MSNFSKDHAIVGKGNMGLPVFTSTGQAFLVPVSIVEGQSAFGRTDVKVTGKRDTKGGATINSARLIDMSDAEAVAAFEAEHANA
jgi:hypothetical protein